MVAEMSTKGNLATKEYTQGMQKLALNVCELTNNFCIFNKKNKF
jgi:hypothetical protein